LTAGMLMALALVITESISQSRSAVKSSGFAEASNAIGGERPLAEGQEQAGKRAYTSGHADAIVRTCRAFVLVLP
jgi:hypothetical protein